MAHVTLQSGDFKRITDALEKSYNQFTFLNFVGSVAPQVVNDLPGMGAPFSFVISEFVSRTQNHGILPRVLIAAQQAFPYRPDWVELNLDLSRRPGWDVPIEAHSLPLKSGLEQITDWSNPFLDSSRFVRWLLDAERRVCQIVISGTGQGTGFLVGPDLVLTCYHVVKDYLTDQIDHTQVGVRFDFRRPASGGAAPVLPTVGVQSKANWTVPHQKYDPADISLIGEPAPQLLDYALLRLVSAPGQETPPGESQKRGWYDLSQPALAVEPNRPAFVVGHPQPAPGAPQEPLQISMESKGFIGNNAGKTRSIYRTNTHPGNSGSPVFDHRLVPLVLHHNRGQQDPGNNAQVLNNRGVPLGLIQQDLAPDVRGLLIPVS